jgi:hypothetical protein
MRDAVHALRDPEIADPPAAEIAAAVRTVCALLAERFPGGTVELRVPPYAAVQLGIGERGRHTRGTPPNVVQTDPLTVLELADGTLGWAQARESHRVQASGIYAELAALWPLDELR